MTFKYYIILSVLSLLSVIIVPFFLPYGGIAPDSISYFKLAKDLPAINSNLFPIGYPILLKVGHSISNEFYFSSRFISILSFIIILLFSYKNKFYVKETIILLSFKFFLSIYTNSISETIFLTLLYFLFYYFHEHFINKKNGISFFLPSVLITISLVLVRYTGIYIFFAIILFFLYKQRKYIFTTQIFTPFFIYILLSAIGIFTYLGANYLYFGSLFGDHIHSLPSEDNYSFFVIENLAGALNVLNPIFSIKILKAEPLYIFLEVLIICIDLLFILVYIYFYTKYFKHKISTFHQTLLIIGSVYFCLMFFSEFFQGIEALNTKMLASASFPFIFSFIILFINQFKLKGEAVLLFIGYISLTFNTLYQLKTPFNYLGQKKKVENILSNKKNIKYFYNNDFENIRKTIYTIPFINKKIEHTHTYIQLGYLNTNIVRMNNPDIVEIKNDNLIKNKIIILYNSELK